MFRRKNRNICAYCNCDRQIPKDDFLCPEHYKNWTDGIIDRCPRCGRFKDIMYYQCLDCYFGRPVVPWEPSAIIPPPPNQHHRVEYSDAWTDGYMKPDRCFVYILELDNGDLYIGHTKDLRKRLSEHRVEGKFSPVGGNPRLQYLEIAATRKAAELRQGELKKLVDSNPEQIRLMISNFRGHMRESRPE